MDFKINAVHFTADKGLISFVEEKVKKLENMYDHIISGEVFLRVDNNDSKENKIAEVRITIPGNELFASKQCQSFEEATDLAVSALRKQVEKHKPKHV